MLSRSRLSIASHADGNGSNESHHNPYISCQAAGPMKESSSGLTRTISPYSAWRSMAQSTGVPLRRLRTKGIGVAAALLGPGNLDRG